MREAPGASSLLPVVGGDCATAIEAKKIPAINAARFNVIDMISFIWMRPTA
jgi:hypothetical protein